MAQSTHARRAGKTASPALDSTQRQRMISEAAYYRFVRRGYAHGHDVEDWLAAEAELLVGKPEARRTVEAFDETAFEVQQHSAISSRKDEVTKRIIRKHPQRDIPQIEGIEPEEAPLKE